MNAFNVGLGIASLIAVIFAAVWNTHSTDIIKWFSQWWNSRYGKPLIVRRRGWILATTCAVSMLVTFSVFAQTFFKSAGSIEVIDKPITITFPSGKVATGSLGVESTWEDEKLTTDPQSGFGSLDVTQEDLQP